MTPPVLVIISGAPASGKTTLARRLAQEFRLPLYAKDDIKELLFDTLGIGDREWSIKLGIATYHLMYQALEIQLRAGRSCMLESNFKGEYATEQLRALKQRYDYLPFQILCRTDPDVLQARFQQRGTSGERHPGHLDHILIEEMAGSNPDQEYTILPIGGASFVLDTTDLTNLRYDEAVAALRAALPPEL